MGAPRRTSTRARLPTARPAARAGPRRRSRRDPPPRRPARPQSAAAARAPAGRPPAARRSARPTQRKPAPPAPGACPPAAHRISRQVDPPGRCHRLQPTRLARLLPCFRYLRWPRPPVQAPTDTPALQWRPQPAPQAQGRESTPPEPRWQPRGGRAPAGAAAANRRSASSCTRAPCRPPLRARLQVSTVRGGCGRYGCGRPRRAHHMAPHACCRRVCSGTHALSGGRVPGRLKRARAERARCLQGVST